MNELNIIQPGKIVTLVFLRSKKPITVCINNGMNHQKLDIIYISPQAPLAQGILNHREGELVAFESPEGELKVRIIKVSN